MKKIETEKSEDFEKIFESFSKENSDNTVDSRPIAIHHVERQKTYLWIRVYLSVERVDLTPNDVITVTYAPTNEKLNAKFACYAKKGLDKDGGEFINAYNPEDDKKILCLMVDSDDLGFHIPTLSSLFKNTIHYKHQLLKRSELTFSFKNSDLEYFDSEF
jgi:hypothetical protein